MSREYRLKTIASEKTWIADYIDVDDQKWEFRVSIWPNDEKFGLWFYKEGDDDPYDHKLGFGSIGDAMDYGFRYFIRRYQKEINRYQKAIREINQ